METAILFGIFVFLFCLNVPIAVSLATAAIIVLATTTDFSLYMIAQRMFAALLSPPLLAILLSYLPASSCRTAESPSTSSPPCAHGSDIFPAAWPS